MNRKQKHRKGLHRKRPYKGEFQRSIPKGSVGSLLQKAGPAPFSYAPGRTGHMKNEGTTFRISEREGVK